MTLAHSDNMVSWATDRLGPGPKAHDLSLNITGEGHYINKACVWLHVIETQVQLLNQIEELLLGYQEVERKAGLGRCNRFQDHQEIGYIRPVFCYP